MTIIVLPSFSPTKAWPGDWREVLFLSKLMGMQFHAQSKRIGLVNCDLDLLHNLLEGDASLESFPGCVVPKGWPLRSPPSCSNWPLQHQR